MKNLSGYIALAAIVMFVGGALYLGACHKQKVAVAPIKINSTISK